MQQFLNRFTMRDKDNFGDHALNPRADNSNGDGNVHGNDGGMLEKLDLGRSSGAPGGYAGFFYSSGICDFYIYI